MRDARQLMEQLFQTNRIQFPAGRKGLLDKFLQDGENKAAINSILQQQDWLMAKWKKEERIAEIRQQPVRILNATVGKPYEARLDFDKLGWSDLTDYSFEGLESLGLQFEKEHRLLTGIPTESGDKKLRFLFKIEGQPEEVPYAEKDIPLIINPDPRSLWKTVPSDGEHPYWKEDNVTLLSPLGDRHLLVSSRRGRSHANVGSLREDDFAFGELAHGWSIVVVADGAGSAKASAKGSAMACSGIVDYFKEKGTAESLAEFDGLLQQHLSENTEEAQRKLNHFVYNTLGKAVVAVHKNLHGFALAEGLTLKDLSATLVFALFKKYEAGYALLSFGVGDCPMAVLNREGTEVTLLNWLDVGEFGGGTRFITMPEIFSSEKFATRFKFKLVNDFLYLVLMTDGIYDPKFVVEAALPESKNWQAFFADVGGQNEEGVSVSLTKDNPDIEQQFSQWMDFWSPGNHDDRTLAIVF